MRMRIEMFGGLRILQGESLLRLRSRQAETLLATLALSPGREFSRHELAQRLWPDAPVETARSRFKQELSALRHILAPPGSSASDYLLTTPDGIRLRTAELTTDVSDFEDLLRSCSLLSKPQFRINQLEQATLLVRGPLLPGTYDPHLLQERERLTQVYGEALHLLARLYAAEGEMIPAMQAARSAVQNDPLQEETRRTLILLSLRFGMPVEAQAQIDAFTELLMQELGEPPSAPLLALAQQAQRFTTLSSVTAAHLRNLSAPLHKLLHTLVQGEGGATSLAALDMTDLTLLESLAQLEEQGLIRSEPSDGVMTYHLPPELKELLQISL